jgi:hypothetical protein
MEQFKACNFSDKHLIGDNGTVKRLDQAGIKRYGTDILTGLVKQDGYKMYYIKNKWYYAHRLVASHYLTNEGNLSDVNHKDGNKANNHVSNLHWCTHAENIQHSYDVLGRKAVSGEAHHMTGKTHTPEAINNMRLAKLGKKRLGKSGKWYKPL